MWRGRGFGRALDSLLAETQSRLQLDNNIFEDLDWRQHTLTHTHTYVQTLVRIRVFLLRIIQLKSL